MKLQGTQSGVSTLEDLSKAVVDLSDELRKILNNGGTFDDNLDAVESITADTGGADAEITITHGLGRIPSGFWVTNIDKAGVLYDSGTAWTDTYLYLKCDVANCNVTIRIF